MATESAIFTALPNGLHESGERWRVTIFVSPRLLTDGAGDARRCRASTSRRSSTGPRRSPTRSSRTRSSTTSDPFDTEPDPDSPPPDSATWHALFGKTEVRDGEVQRHGRARSCASFPVADASKYVLDLYRQVAEGYPTAFPPITSGPLPTRRRHRQPVASGRSPSLLPDARGRVHRATHSQGEEARTAVALRRPHTLPGRRAGQP